MVWGVDLSRRFRSARVIGVAGGVGSDEGFRSVEGLVLERGVRLGEQIRSYRGAKLGQQLELDGEDGSGGGGGERAGQETDAADASPKKSAISEYGLLVLVALPRDQSDWEEGGEGIGPTGRRCRSPL